MNVLIPCKIQLPDGKYIKTEPTNIQKNQFGKPILDTTDSIDEAFQTMHISYAQSIKNTLKNDFNYIVKIIEIK
ncbi:hypothetical protein G9F72_004505 [Clostridium estertheticum]|uniref:hypothetical protein n=1 Tax=Clostridium estertheticum TaxID=238834 RepID=UPI0013E96C21|nr:hypothetical protein [Clostridium estertheticum]MBZ9685613.1 hypothetical protein [Clostridium estertheticum]